MKFPLHPLRIVCAALAGWALLAQPLAAQAKHVRVWILSGQSNMGGGAQIQPYGNPPQEGDIWYRRSVAPDPGSDEWTPLSDVISRGVESRFGERMAEEFPDDIIALLKCNRGGSGLGPWLPGGEFYATMMGRLDAVESDLNARVQSGEISGWSYDGYLWMQGETEAALAAAGWPAEQYIRSLEQLVATMRERTGVSDLPFVLGRIYDFGLHQAPEHESTWPNLINVRYAQEYYPLIDPRSAWLNTDDLAMSMTEPHYHSYEEMGHRFAHGFMNIHNGAQLPFRPHRVAPGAGGPTDWQPISLARTPGDGQVMLDWSHALHADTYSIHYGTSADALTQSVTGITANQVTVTGLQNGTTYYFAARSHNAAGSSPFTDVVSATPNGSTSGTPFVWTQDLKRTLFLPSAVSPTPAYAEVLEIHQTLQLDGTVRDDSPGLGVTWSVVSGTGTVTFGDANAIDTTATFSATGRYFLRLTASDGARSASHDLEVNVIATVANTAPSVSTFWHPTINVLDTAQLEAALYNTDRRPAFAPYTYLWEQTEGPAPANFARADYWLSPTTFAAPGVYRFRFTGSDSDLSASDTLTLAVNPAGTRNWALGKPTASSSAQAEDTAGEYMVDGDVNDFNDFYSRRFQTLTEANPWGEVDLESVAPIDFIRIWNIQDGNASRLNNYYVFVSPEPFSSTDPAATVAQLNGNGGWYVMKNSIAGFPEVIPVNASGRYVRVQLTATTALTVKELEVVGPSGPDAPAISSAVSEAADSARLRWQDVSGESGYRVRRALSADGPWTEIGGDLPGNSTEFTDTGLEQLTEYWYQVQSFNDVAPSAWSDAVMVRTLSALIVPEVNAAALPLGFAGNAYSHDLDIIGGTPPYAVALSGNLPPGISADDDGLLSGTPAFPGTRRFGVEITDDAGESAAVELELTVVATDYATPGAGVVTEQSSLFNTNVPGRAIDGLLTTWNHTDSETEAWWQIDFGAPVPLQAVEIFNRENSASRLTNFYILLSNAPFAAGQTLADHLADPAVVAIHDPTQALFPSLYPLDNDTSGNYRYARVQLTARNYLHMVEFSAYGSMPPQLPAQALPPADKAAAYAVRLEAHSGHGLLEWGVGAGGALPGGLTLSSDGVLSGTPAESGTFAIPFVVTDQLGQTAARTLSLEIRATLADQWRALHFTNPETNPDAAWTADPEGDALSNLMEYALGTDPLAADRPQVLEFSLSAGNPVFTTPPLVADPALQYTIEFSTNLADWDSGPTQYTLTVDDLGDGTVRLIATDEQSIELVRKRFARLKISLP